MIKFSFILALFVAIPVHLVFATPRTMHHGSWEVSCDSSSENKDEGRGTGPCRATQRLSVEGSDRPIFAVTVMAAREGGGKGGATFVGIVSIPLGGYIAPGIDVQIDRQKPFRLLVETCNVNGCHAGFPVSGPILAQLKAGKSANVRLWVTKAKPVDITLSLDGFSKALGEVVNASGKPLP